MDPHNERLRAFERQHIIDTIAKMATDLRRAADALDRVAKDERYDDASRANTAWGEIRNLNSNLRVDILISSLGRLIEVAGADKENHQSYEMPPCGLAGHDRGSWEDEAADIWWCPDCGTEIWLSTHERTDRSGNPSADKENP